MGGEFDVCGLDGWMDGWRDGDNEVVEEKNLGHWAIHQL